MKLSQMQDLGGCRAVVKDVHTVEKLVAAYREAIAKNPKARHEFLHCKDYITHPKADGYRGYHMVLSVPQSGKKAPSVQRFEDRDSDTLKTSARLGNCCRDRINIHRPSIKVEYWRGELETFL
jgi:hypothetical protein